MAVYTENFDSANTYAPLANTERSQFGLTVQQDGIGHATSPLGVYTEAYKDGTTHTADCYGQIRYISGAGACNIMLRWDVAVSNGAGYTISFDFSAGTINIYKSTAGVETPVLEGTAFTFAANDLFYARIVGSLISIFKNGVLLFGVTDTTHTAGNPVALGIYSSGGANLYMDDWESGDYAAAPTITLNLIAGPFGRLLRGKF